MRPILCLALLSAPLLKADEAQDRAAIDKAIVSLSDPAHRAAVLAKDVDSSVDFDHLAGLHHRYGPAVIGMNETWTILTTPRIVSESIRFLTPDVAVVDGASTVERAPTLIPRVPLLFVVKREDGQWKVTTIRILR